MVQEQQTITTTFILTESISGELGAQTAHRSLYVGKQLIATEVLPLNCHKVGTLGNIVDLLDAICGYTSFNEGSRSCNNVGNNGRDIGKSLCEIFRMHFRLQLRKFKLSLRKFTHKHFGLKCKTSGIKEVKSIGSKR